MVMSHSHTKTNNVIRGTVRNVNKKTRKAAIELEAGNYVIIELPHVALEPDDMLSGELLSVGSTIVRNDTTEELLHVYVQEVNVTFERAEQLLS